jgi:hypothetical protein
MTIFARKVQVIPQTANRREVTYIDLCRLPAQRYALMDGLSGKLITELSEEEALAQLKGWEDWVRADPDGNLSQVTNEGKRFLREAGACR